MRKWAFVVFPHAGGLGQNFFKLKPHLPPEADFICVDYRGKKSASVQDLAARLLEDLRPKLFAMDTRIAFLGYSLGGLVAYEMACLLADQGREPELLMTAAMVPPQIQGSRPESEKYHPLSDELFIEKMEREAGINAAAFRDPIFRKAFLPALRQEVEIAEKYQFIEKKQRLSCRVISLYGREDKIVFKPGRGPEEFLERLGAWGQLTTGKFVLHLVGGGHFFLLEDSVPGMALIRQELNQDSSPGIS